jgi:hypothetical protein
MPLPITTIVSNARHPPVAIDLARSTPPGPIKTGPSDFET